MPKHESRKYQKKVELIKAIVGADIERDLLQVALGEVDVDAVPMTTNVSEPLNISLDYVAGVEQSGSDLVSDIGDILEALNSNGTDYFRSELYAQDPDGNLINLQVDSNGEIEASLDAETVGVDDSDGTRIDPATQALENALKANDADELISRITDSDGTEIDPATKALEAALKSNDTDEFVSRLVGADGNEVQEVALDTAASATDVALVTYLARALNTIGNDELVSRLTDSTGSQIDPATQDLEAALKSNDGDEFITRVTDPSGNELSVLSQGDLPVDTDLFQSEVDRFVGDVGYSATYRATGVADGDTAADLVISNPSDSGADVIVEVKIKSGGLATLDHSEDITIDTAGTSVTQLPKNAESGTTSVLNVEQGGSYTTNGGTEETIVPGSSISGGPATATGSETQLSGKYLNPGDSLRYNLTNASGSQASLSVEVDIVEV